MGSLCFLKPLVLEEGIGASGEEFRLLLSSFPSHWMLHLCLDSGHSCWRLGYQWPIFLISSILIIFSFSVYSWRFQWETLPTSQCLFNHFLKYYSYKMVQLSFFPFHLRTSFPAQQSHSDRETLIFPFCLGFLCCLCLGICGTRALAVACWLEVGFLFSAMFQELAMPGKDSSSDFFKPVTFWKVLREFGFGKTCIQILTPLLTGSALNKWPKPNDNVSSSLMWQ